MFPVNLRTFAPSAPETIQVISKSNETGLASQNIAHGTGSSFVSSDLDAATMKVCRVCLAMNVKMYHILEHKLCPMYEQVTGIQINTEDKLPKKLCWECVARLTSAKHFKEKALKTNLMLLKKINDEGSIKISDIKAIDKIQNGLKSTLGHKLVKANNFHLHITEDKVITDNINKGNEIINKSNDNYCNEDHQETEFSEIKAEIDFNYEEQMNKTVRVTDEKDPIKSEPVEVTDDQVGTDEVAVNFTCVDIRYEIKSENTEISSDEIEISIKKENMSDTFTDDETNDPTIEEEYEMKIKQKRKMRNNLGRASLPCCKKPVAILKKKKLSKTQDSYKQLDTNAETTEEKNDYTQNKDRNLFKNDNNVVETPNKSAHTIKAPKYKNIKIKHLNMSDSGYTSQSSTSTTNNCVPNYSASLQKRFICDMCTKPFQQKSTLVQHILKHPNLFNCSYCSYKSHQKVNLNRHINTIHTKSICFDCPHCSYKAYRKFDLQQHINAVHKGISFGCAFCSFKTYSKVYLSRHVNAAHTKNTSFNCSHCSYKTYHKGHLYRHVNTKHSKIKSVNCSYCSYGTYSKASLLIHINAKHTKSVSFNCPHCSFKTYRKGDLGKHVNAAHTKNISFNCSHCSYKTCRRFDLNRHVKAKHP